MILTHHEVIRKRTVPIHESSREHAVVVKRRVTLLPSVLTSLPQNATTASKKVPHHRLHVLPCLLLTLPSGHETSGCKANRVFDTSSLPDMSAEDAWAALQKADEEHDLEDFREVRAS